MAEKRFHYAWLVVLAGTLTTMASLGLGRFALGMLLPSMGRGLGLTYSQMGLIGTANFVGYMLSVLMAGRLSRIAGTRRLITSSLVLAGVSMLLISRSTDFLPVMLLYFITGMASGASNVPMMGLVTVWFYRNMRARAAGFMVIGSGFAIIASGLVVPAVNAAVGAEGWRVNWMLFAAAVTTIAVIIHIILRDTPSEMGLEPLGNPEHASARVHHEGSVFSLPAIYHLGAIYLLFGFTYVIYATFAVTSMVADWGMPEAKAGMFWMWVGAVSLLSGPVFGSVTDRFGRRVGLSSVFAFQGAAFLLIALGWWLNGKGSHIILYASVFCFGVSAWSVPSIMAATVGDYIGPSRAAEGFGALTFIFSLGQVAGPAVAGSMAERAGSFGPAFVLASVLAALAIALSAVLKRPGATSQGTSR